MTLPGGERRPAVKIRVSRALFAEAFRSVLYTPDGVAQAPKLIHQFVNGDDRGLTETALAGRMLLGDERLAAGYFLSVTCTEDVPFLATNADALAAGTFGGTYRLDQQRAACKEWTRGTCIGRMIGQFLDRASVEGLDVSCAAAVTAIPFVVPAKAK